MKRPDLSSYRDDIPDGTSAFGIVIGAFVWFVAFIAWQIIKNGG